MAKLPDRSMIRKIMTILEYADSNTPSTPKDLSAEIYKGRRVEFSYYSHQLISAVGSAIVNHDRLSVRFILL